MQLRFYEHALEGDVASGALVAKLIERRGVMLGLHTPQTAVLQIVDEAKPRETSTDRIERALNALLTDGRKGQADEAQAVKPEPGDADDA
jgi:pyridoxal/pyridoxine/pyridoxamine kinase